MPSTASSRASSSANGLGALRQVAPVRADVLPEQRDLPDALCGHALDLLQDLARRPRHLAPSRGGHDAVGAAAVAADRDLDPGLELALALHRQVPGEALELLGGDAVARQELGELVHLTRAERNVDEREHVEDLVLQRLRPAAADPDHPLRVLFLEPLGLAEVAHEPVVGLLADGAGVEQDQVGARALPASLYPSDSSMPFMRSESCSFIWHPKVVRWYVFTAAEDRPSSGQAAADRPAPAPAGPRTSASRPAGTGSAPGWARPKSAALRSSPPMTPSAIQASIRSRSAGSSAAGAWDWHCDGAAGDERDEHASGPSRR